MTNRRDDIDRLAELEELFADLWQVPRFAAGLRRGHRPPVDVFRTTDPPELVIVVDVAGADPASIDITLEGRRFVVAGERPRPRVRAQFDRSEIEYGPFQRELVVNYDIDATGARAEYDRGLLRVALPIAQRAPAASRVTVEVRRAP